MNRRGYLLPAVATCVGVVALIAITVVDLRAGFHAYLAGYLLVAGAPVGCLSILMVYHLTGGRWGGALRPAVEAMLPTLPVAALLFVPILAGMDQLFPWVHPMTANAIETASHKELYLNLPFFIVRAVIFFATWILLALALRRLARSPVDRSVGLARLSAGGLVAWFLTVSFAAVDWIASLTPEWYTTIIGMYVLISFTLTAFCIATLVVVRPGRDPDADVLNDLGNLLLMLVVLHAYLAFSQFLIIWNGNKPHEISWYVPRATTAWLWFYGAFAVLHFALPLAVLLQRTVKRRARAMRALVLLILFARAAEAVYWVVPKLEDHQALAAGGAVAASLAIGGVWLMSYLWWWRRDGREAA